MQHWYTFVRTSALGLTAGAALLAGCQRSVNVPRGAVDEAPLVVDEAMELRDWEPMTAYYANPRFIAGPAGFWFMPAYHMPAWVYPLQETPMFLAQAIALPVTMWFPPLWTPVQYAGETLEPTWHAMPPLPPARDDARDARDAREAFEVERDEPLPPPPEPLDPGEAAPAPYEEAPGQTVIPSTQPTRGIEGGMPTTPPADPELSPRAAPRRGPTDPRVVTPAPTVRTTPAPTPATQPVYVPSAVTPRTTTPATRPSTAPAMRDMNK